MFDGLRVREWWNEELPRMSAKFRRVVAGNAVRGDRDGRVRAMGGMAKRGASRTSANEAATRIGRRDFGLAEEIARVERAARDWGVHADALEGRFVRALLKAIGRREDQSCDARRS